MKTKGEDMDLNELNELAREYDTAHFKLETLVKRTNEILEGVKRRAMSTLKRHAADAAAKKKALEDAINENPALFIKPRSRVFGDVKFGVRKQKGEISWEDEAKVLKLIKKHFDETRAEDFIQTTEKPLKSALEKLSADTLRKLGIELTKDSDEVFVKHTGTQIEKLVNALLKGAEDAGKEEDAAV